MALDLPLPEEVENDIVNFVQLRPWARFAQELLNMERKQRLRAEHDRIKNVWKLWANFHFGTAYADFEAYDLADFQRFRDEEGARLRLLEQRLNETLNETLNAHF